MTVLSYILRTQSGASLLTPASEETPNMYVRTYLVLSERAE